MSPRERFDASYYHRHYIGEDRVHTVREIGFLASGIFGLAGWFGMELRSVLDVGAGMGLWRTWLAANHPRVKYRSVDVSPYACATWGHERRDISEWRARERYDLVVCHSVLQYLDDEGAERAIENLGAMCRGLLYLEVITRADGRVVDLARTDTAVHARTGAWYRGRLERHFQQVGAGLWASRRSKVLFYELEAAGR